MRRYNGVIYSSAGVLQTGINVTVRVANTPTVASLYNDQMNPIGNPTTTDASGQVSFRVTSGIYDFVDDDGNYLGKEIQIFDFSNPGEWLGVWDFPKVGFTFGGPSSKLRIYGLSDDILSVDSAMRIGGLQGAGNAGLLVNANGLGDNLIEARNNALDQYPMFMFTSLGYIYFGPGSSFATDVYLGRSAAGEITIGGNAVVLGNWKHKGSQIGFFNSPSVSQPTINGTVLDATNDATLIALLKGLQLMGLINANFTIKVSGTIAVTFGGTVLNAFSVTGTAAVVVGGTATATVA